ncbi:hypothetical protein P7C71_g5911, partial [Lecanoromycetidae sp. Uapishka_2]
MSSANIFEGGSVDTIQQPKETPKPMIAHVNAAPKGDVIFVLSSSNSIVHLRVSSRVLSLASPVFAAMFSPRWYEVNESSSPRKIALPEDDPIAMY